MFDAITGFEVLIFTTNPAESLTIFRANGFGRHIEKDFFINKGIEVNFIALIIVNIHIFIF